MINEIEKTVNEVNDGTKDALQAYGELKDLETILKQSVQEVYEIAVGEASKYEKTFHHLGFKFELRNGATRYSSNMVCLISITKSMNLSVCGSGKPDF